MKFGLLAVWTCALVVGCAGEGEGEGEGGEGEGEGEGAVSDLPKNCIDSANASDPVCNRDDPGGSTIGAGPPISTDIGVHIGGGFLDGNNAVFAVSGDSHSGYGFVMSVDLTTGDRTVLSGQFDDPVNGNQSVGTGPEWNEPVTVSQGPDGLYVGSVEGTGAAAVFKVDASGNRTLFVELDTLNCDAGGTRLFIGSEIVVGDDGTVYAPAGDSVGNEGLVSVTDTACTPVTYSGNAAASIPPIGTGASMDGLRGVTFSGGKVFGLDFVQQSLFSIDVATGARARVSSWSSDATVGSGDALPTGFVRIAGGTAWASGSLLEGDTVLAKVDLATGDRTTIDIATGSASNVAEVTVLGQVGSDVVIGAQAGLHLVDPVAGDSNRISR